MIGVLLTSLYLFTGSLAYNPRIQSGIPVLIDDWPSTVSLLTRDDTPNVDASAWKLRCGGVIISQYHMLTSAWCLKSIVEKEFAVKDVIVRGNTEYWECSCGRKRDHAIGGYYIHEGFNQQTPFKPTPFFENDIGIVTVENAFSGLYEILAPHNIGSKFWTSASKNTAVVGWGFYDGKQQIQEQLRAGYLVVRSADKCSEIYGKPLPRNTYCASHPGSNIFGPCEYDTGGPHFGRVEDEDILIGIISTGQGCSEKPAVFTNVSGYADWISEKINGNLNSNDGDAHDYK